MRKVLDESWENRKQIKTEISRMDEKGLKIIGMKLESKLNPIMSGFTH